MKEFIGGLVLGILGVIGVYFKFKKNKNPAPLFDMQEEATINETYVKKGKELNEQNPPIKSKEDVIKELNRNIGDD